jgi:hypothetical protein
MISGRKSQKKKKAHQKAEEYEDEERKNAVKLLNIISWHTVTKRRINERKYK